MGEGLGSFLIRSVAGTGIVRISAMIASFAVGVQLARGLGVQGYGYYGMALAVVTIAGIPSQLGIPKVVTREIAAARNDYRRVFGVLHWGRRVCLIMSMAVGLGVAAAGLVLIHGDNSPLGTAMIAGSPMIVFLALARLQGGALQGLHHIVRGQVPANLMQPLVLSILLFATWIAGRDLDPMLAMALNAVSCLVVFLVADRWLRQRLPKRMQGEVVRGGRRWIASAIPLALADSMRILQGELSVLILGAVTDPAIVGLFRIANITAMNAAAPIRIVGHVALPVIARLHAEEQYERLQKAVTGFAWSGFAGACLLSFPLFVFAGPLVRLVFGNEFTPAADALRILLFGQILNAAFGPNAILLNMTRYERRTTRAMAIAAVLNVILVPVCAHFWGVTGAAAGMVVSLVCWNVQTWMDGRRLLGVETSIVPLAWARLRHR
jgi:O-antigen/teichoic acid export membrane protein